MILQIETVTTNTGKLEVFRDVETVRRIVAIAEKAMDSIRDHPCGHKPNGVGGKCQACEALAEWDAISSNARTEEIGKVSNMNDKAEPKSESDSIGKKCPQRECMNAKTHKKLIGMVNLSLSEFERRRKRRILD